MNKPSRCLVLRINLHDAIETLVLARRLQREYPDDKNNNIIVAQTEHYLPFMIKDYWSTCKPGEKTPNPEEYVREYVAYKVIRRGESRRLQAILDEADRLSRDI